MGNSSKLVEKYFRTDNLPHIWCPGCSHGILTRGVVEAIDNLGLDQDKTVIVSGIGCSSRSAGYLDFSSIHTTHGRALAFATGIKLSKPELNVIVISGDGDASAIGGNHLIHACRRNIDITCIIYNNNIYGMTGGQYSPTTPHNALATTMPYGNMDNAFDIHELVKGAGATYYARGTAYHIQQLIKIYEKAIKHKGFSVVEAVTVCPTYYGRKNKSGSAVDMVNWMKDNFIPKRSYDRLDDDKKANKIPIGEFYSIEKPEFVSEYVKMVEAMGEK